MSGPATAGRSLPDMFSVLTVFLEKAPNRIDLLLMD